MPKREEITATQGILLEVIAKFAPSSLYELHQRATEYEQLKKVSFSVVLRNAKWLEKEGYIRLTATGVRRAKKPELTAWGLIEVWKSGRVDHTTLLTCLGRFSKMIAKIKGLPQFKDEGFVNKVIGAAIPFAEHEMDLELFYAHSTGEEPRNSDRVFIDRIEERVVSNALPELPDSEVKSLDTETRKRIIEILERKIEQHRDEAAKPRRRPKIGKNSSRG